MHADPATGELVNGIKKVRYSHDAMIDLMIAEPTVKQNDLAAIFDRTPTWISLVVNSDAFQARLSERKAELIDPAITASINERINAVASKALERIHEKLAGPLGGLASDDFLIKSAKLALDAAGFGARVPTSASVTNNLAVIVQVPPKAPSASEWASTYAPAAVTPQLVERT